MQRQEMLEEGTATSCPVSVLHSMDTNSVGFALAAEAALKVFTFAITRTG